MIELESVTARSRTLGSVRDLSARWDSGVHAVVGPIASGTSLVLALAAGAVAPRAGRLTVCGGAPRASKTRRHVSWTPLAPPLPAAMRVADVLALASRLRGDAPSAPDQRLAELGLEALARRTVSSLSQAEARGVSLVEGLTSSAVAVVLIEEPLTMLDAAAVAVLPEALRAAGRAGKAVLFATASLRDAYELGQSRLDLGVPLQGPARSEERTLRGALSIVLHTASDARAVVSALEREAAVARLERDAHVIRLGGEDAEALARAAGRALVAAGTRPVALRLDPEDAFSRQAWS